MLLDERCFENEGLDFVIGDDEFDVGDLPDEFFGLDAVTEIAGSARLKVRAHTIPQVDRLANIDDRALFVFHQVAARLGRQRV